MVQSILKAKFSDLRTADTESVDLLINLFVPVHFNKGRDLTAPEHSFPVLYFIEAGLVRGYFFYQKEIYTCWILEQGFLIAGAKPANNHYPLECIEVLADTTGWSLNLRKAELLAKKNPSMYRILFEIYQESIWEGKNRELMLRIPNAEGRYLFARKRNSSLVYKVINSIYGSFLNIEPKYLFRIKKKLRL